MSVVDVVGVVVAAAVYDPGSVLCDRGRRRMFDEMIILLLLLMFMVMFILPASCSSEMQVHELLTCFEEGNNN